MINKTKTFGIIALITGTILAGTPHIKKTETAPLRNPVPYEIVGYKTQEMFVYNPETKEQRKENVKIPITKPKWAGGYVTDSQDFFNFYNHDLFAVGDLKRTAVNMNVENCFVTGKAGLNGSIIDENGQEWVKEYIGHDSNQYKLKK